MEESNIINTKINEPREIIILGTGPAGLTAAIYAARAGLKPLILHGDLAGGQLTTTTEVENFPGFPSGADGNFLINQMMEQAEKFGAEFKYSLVNAVDFSKQGDLKLKTSEDEIISTRSLIIATGARPRKLGLPSEERLWSHGVTSCATCDGYFYRGMEVCVIGGGDSAMEEATFLTRFCTRVYLIHRRDKFRASKIMSDRLLKNEKITVVWNSVVDEILGDEKVSGIRISNLVTKEFSILPVKGVFLAIGHIPNTEPFKGILEMDEDGYLLTDSRKGCNSSRTNVQGVFACGDCQDKVFRQAITASGTGCMAAIEAERWLEANDI